MGKTLVIAEVYEGELRAATFSTVAAAKELQEQTSTGFDIAVLADDAGAHAEALKSLGAEQVIKIEDGNLAHYLAETWAPNIAELAKSGDYTTVLAPVTTTGKDLMPRVAALLDAGMASDIIGIEGADTFKRPVYAGNLVATVKLKTERKVVSVRGTAFPKAEPGGGESTITSADAVGVSPKGEFLGFEGAGGSDRPDLTEAGIVVSGGRGTKGEFDPVYQLADTLGAAVGASRAVVDAGWAPNDWQVGQTGKVVAPELYIALGISGAIQHWAGMKDSKTIVAVNKDPEAPIMELADYAIVADLFNAAPELAEKLKSLKDAGEISV